MIKTLRTIAMAALAMVSMNVMADEVTMAYSGTSTTNMTGQNDAALVGLNADLWTVIGDKGSNSNYPGLNKAGDIRLYYSASGSNTITVTAADGTTINDIAITFTGDDYSNVSVTVGENAITPTDGKYAINSTSFILGNANTSNVQVRIKKIVIDYTVGDNSKQSAGLEWSEDNATVTIGGNDNVFPTLANPNNLTVGYDSSNPDVATIDVNGNVTLVAAGKTTISAAFDGDDSYYASTVKYTLTVNPAQYVSGDYSYTFDEQVFEENGTQNLGGVNWTLTATWGNNAYFGYDTNNTPSKGMQIGSGSNPATAITLTTDDIKEAITKITVETSGANSIEGTLDVTVGGTVFGEQYTLTKTSTAVDFASPASKGTKGEIKLAYAQTSSKAIYIKAIKVIVYNEATGLSTVKTAANNGVVYNMAGQRVAAGYKGLVIMNGKKVVMK